MYIEEIQPTKDNMDLNKTIRNVLEDSVPGEKGTQGDDEEYAKKRDAVLKKYGVKSCAQCETDKEKKACFNDLDAAHVADHEEETKKKTDGNLKNFGDNQASPFEKEDKKESFAKTPGMTDTKQKIGVKKKAKEPQEQKEQSKLLSHIRKLMKGS